MLAAFTAGAVMNDRLRTDEGEGHAENVHEACGRFFDLPIMIVFGADIPWAAWGDLGWRAVGSAFGVLLLRRLPAWLFLHRFMPWTTGWRDASFAGWFGPIGAAAMFYAMDIPERTHLPDIWPAISLALGASILAHGVSGTPLIRLLGRMQATSGQVARDASRDR